MGAVGWGGARHGPSDVAQRLPWVRIGNPGRHGGAALKGSWGGGGRFPKLRQDSYFVGFLEPRRMAEKALTAKIQEPTSKASRRAWSRNW